MSQYTSLSIVKTFTTFFFFFEIFSTASVQNKKNCLSAFIRLKRKKKEVFSFSNLFCFNFIFIRLYFIFDIIEICLSQNFCKRLNITAPLSISYPSLSTLLNSFSARFFGKYVQISLTFLNLFYFPSFTHIQFYCTVEYRTYLFSLY